MTNVHEKKPRNTVDSICEICGKKIMYAFQMASHILTHRDRELTRVQCDICGKWIKNLNTLRSHRLTHNQSPKTCPHCGKIKKNQRALTAHISAIHSTPKHQCTVCGKAFTRLSSLKVYTLEFHMIQKKSKSNTFSLVPDTFGRA